MKNSYPFKLLILLTGVSLLSLGIKAQQVSIYTTQDASITTAHPDSTIKGKVAGSLHNFFAWRTAKDTVVGFLRFDISRFKNYTISSASFSVRGAQYIGSTNSSYMLELYEAGQGWSEDTVTWNNKPAIGTTLLASRDLSNTSARRAFTSNGTSLVDLINSRLAAGITTLDFVLKSNGTGDTASSTSQMWIGSHEDGSYAPQLLIMLENQVMGFKEDMTVSSLYPDSTIVGKPGGHHNIFAWRNASDTTIAFLKFDLTQVSAGWKLSDAQFSLRAAQYMGSTDYWMFLHRTGDSFTDTTGTFNTKPGITTTDTLTYRDLSGKSARRNFVNKGTSLVDYINSKISAAASVVSFALNSGGTGDTAKSSADMWIGSHEDGSYGPQLALSYGEQDIWSSEDATATSKFPDSTIVGKPGGYHNVFVWRNPSDTTIAFIRFNISSLSGYANGVSDVNLSFRGRNYMGSADYHLYLYQSGNTWDQDTVSWHYLPVISPDTLGNATLSATSSARQDFAKIGTRLVDYLKAAIGAGNSYIDFAVRSGGTGDSAKTASDMWIGSSEDGSYGPQLRISFAKNPSDPVLDHASGDYYPSVTVNLLNKPANDTVRYETGKLTAADPTRNSLIFPAEGLLITDTTAIKVTAFRGSQSKIISAFYTVHPLGQVQFDPSPFVKYQGKIVVTLSCQPADSVGAIYYSMGDCNPSEPYTGPITITQTSTICALAYNKAFDKQTPVYSATYQVVNTASLPGTGPGGVGYKDLTRDNQPELGLWLKPELLGTHAAGDDIVLWNDASGNGNNAVNTYNGTPQPIDNTGEQTTPAPKYIASGLNGFPILDFGQQSGTGKIYGMIVPDADNLDGGQGISLFLVLKRNEMFGDFAALIQKRDIRGGDPNKQTYTWEMNGGDNPNMVQFVLARDIFLRNEQVINATDYYILNVNYMGLKALTNFITNGKTESTLVYNKPVLATAAPVLLGGFQPMNLAEAISFNSDLQKVQYNIITQALAAKYGLPLTDGTNSTKLYSSTSYINDVIGIGKDNPVSGVDPEEHLYSSGGQIEIKASSIPNVGDYVFVGHNGGSLSAETREYFVETVNGPVDITLGFNFAEAGMTYDQSKTYQLQYKANAGDTWTALAVVPQYDAARSMLNFQITGIQKGFYALQTITGVKNVTQKNTDLSLYPNPANDHMTLSLVSPENGLVKIRILDNIGRSLVESVIYKQSPVLQHELNLNQLEPGSYLIELRQGNNRMIKNFVKN